MGTALACIAAMLLFAVLQSLLALRLVRFEQTFAAVVTLGGILGVWLLLNGLLALKGSTLPGGLARITIAFSLSYSLGAAGYRLAGYEQPLLWAGAALGYLLGLVWAFWLGWLVQQGRLVPVSALPHQASRWLLRAWVHRAGQMTREDGLRSADEWGTMAGS